MRGGGALVRAVAVSALGAGVRVLAVLSAVVTGLVRTAAAPGHMLPPLRPGPVPPGLLGHLLHLLRDCLDLVILPAGVGVPVIALGVNIETKLLPESLSEVLSWLLLV